MKIIVDRVSVSAGDDTVPHKREYQVSEEMAKVYIALSTEDGYEGFLYDEKYREVKANAFAYEEEEQKKLYSLLEQMTSLKDNE